MAMVDRLVDDNRELLPCRPTVEKEFLQMEILSAFRKGGLLTKLVFKGGTCLRLCRSGERLSEDLDFAVGGRFDASLLDDLEDVMIDQIGATYGLEVSVRARNVPAGAKMAGRWIARVVTRPNPTGSTSNVGVQRIKIEVSGEEEPGDPELLRARLPYDHTAGAAHAVLLNCVPLSSTVRDKLVALPLSVARRNNPRYRDLWDLHAYRPRGVAVGEAVRAARTTAQNSMAIGEYEDVVGGLLRELRDVAESPGFEATMRRFLPRDLADRTVGNAAFREAMCNDLSELFAFVLDPSSMSPVNQP